MTRLRFILVSFFAAVAACLGWRRKPEGLEFRNHNFGDLVDFVDDPLPPRFEDGPDGKLRQVLCGGARWRTARYEARIAIRSRTPKVPAPCVIIFARVEPDRNYCAEWRLPA